MPGIKADESANTNTPSVPFVLREAPVPAEFAGLVTAVERDIVPWLPREPGYPATIYGTLVAIRDVKDPVFDDDKPATTHKMMVLDSPQLVDAWWGVHALHQAFRREIMDALEGGHLQVGYYVSVSYRGTSKKPPRIGQKPAEIYRLSYSRPGGAVVDSTVEESEQEPF
jgi:hypothetical protein